MAYTMNKFHFLYGEVEWRVKVAGGKGIISSAFLFSPMCTPVTTNCKGHWPPSATVIGVDGNDTFAGEVKAVYLNDNKSVVATQKHYTSSSDLAQEFHVYKMVWSETYLGFFFDGREILNTTEPNEIPSISMQLVMKLAVGGPFLSASHPDASTVFPAHFSIDYVVVRQYPNQTSSLTQTQQQGGDTSILAPVLGSVITVVVLLACGAGICVTAWVRKRRRLYVGSMRKGSSSTDRSTLAGSEVNLAYIRTCSGEVATALINYVRLLEVPLANIQMSNVILGKGEFGVVRKGLARLNCSYVFNPVEVAIKMVRDKNNPDHTRQLVEEIKMMSKAARHLNICNLLGIVLKGDILLLLEFSRYGSLLQYLKDHRDRFYNHTSPDGDLLFYDEKYADSLERAVDAEAVNGSGDSKIYDGRILATRDLINFAFQISRGMEYLGTRSIIHRDLAARNVLVCDGRVIKISDFGMSKQMAEYILLDHQAVLPVRWMAPESITDKIFSARSDVWSFGVVVWELFTLGELPYGNTRMDIAEVVEHLTALRHGSRLERPAICPTPVYALMQECWHLDPGQRPDFAQLTHELGDFIGDDSVSPYLCLDMCYNQFNYEHRDLLDGMAKEPENTSTTS
ncbi:fibroblast growth factor receptor 3-like isoform X2 [Paramacrobiotus metropolitanus]|nr:fibroblast growth factor receptor 3-like isoform X2 [Paramacrobiotus metropolitanus]